MLRIWLDLFAFIFGFMSKFVLKFLWLQKSVAVGLDQVVGERTTPLTEFFFWPQHDAWEDMKNFLEGKTWISQTDSIVLLNLITEVINDWQDKTELERKDVKAISDKFVGVLFIGCD